MTKRTEAEIAVAGHICLDICPTFERAVGNLAGVLQPGKLVQVGSAITTAGGVVSNTGLAMYLLGIPTVLMAKVGDDTLARAIIDYLDRQAPDIRKNIKLEKNTPTSYTVIISPPATDRCFLHCTGTNDTFSSEDIAYDELANVRLFHFGYPPLMRRMYLDGGRELELIFKKAKETGVTTSLDMAVPDPNSEAGKQDWPAILGRALPYVDVFLPSFDEILYMLRPSLSREELALVPQEGSPVGDSPILSILSERLLDMGVGIVALKLGSEGLYGRVTADESRLASLGRAAPAHPEDWLGMECRRNCFKVSVVATAGSGDTTIAGFLGGLLKGLSLEGTMTAAVGLGACTVERPDILSGVPTWEKLISRITNEWKSPIR